MTIKIKTYDELKLWAKKIAVQDVFDMSQSRAISGTDRSIVYSVAKLLKAKDVPSFKQLRVLERVYEQIRLRNSSDAVSSVDELIATAQRQVSDIDIKHLCLRTAWHDHAWNGAICQNPKANQYCVGEYSLLSERLRRRRDLDIEGRVDCSACKADSSNLGEYQPPCFWSINTFGKESLTFAHDNPVAVHFPKIAQTLPPYSTISWPFNLSFVRDKAEQEKYGGKYYPKDIFENRIKIFQRYVKPAASVVFTYCNFSNPVSGEAMKYLVTGCALLAEQGTPQYFDVTDAQLAQAAAQFHEPNFPKMNWALRYTLDVEQTGVRLPYHEYLERIEKKYVTEEFLQDIAVTIDEPELWHGFTYVAKHIDDDEAIYLLMKIRRSLIKVREHGFIDATHTDDQLERIEQLIQHAWNKRGYLPGLKSLLSAIPGVNANYSKQVIDLIENLDLSDDTSFGAIRTALSGGDGGIPNTSDGLFGEVADFMNARSLSSDQFLRLASLNLTAHQFARILSKEGITKPLGAVCDNPYLLYEEYQVGEKLEDTLSGAKIDGLIDIFKIDISLIPLAKYQRRIKDFHNWRTTDIRRLRAVVIQVLRSQESTGDCFLGIAEIAEDAKAYSLFYQTDTSYEVEEHLTQYGEAMARHFSDKLVVRTISTHRHFYLKELFDDEVLVRNIIGNLRERKAHNASATPLEADISDSIRVLSGRLGSRFDATVFRGERERLYRQIASKSFFVITGSPGAGKSYELLKLVNFFNMAGETHVVLSLTGKAVIRLRNNEEGIRSINAKTVDKFLNEQENVRAQAATSVIHNLIIDEASMLDLPKFAGVLRSLDLSHLRRLILVGDPNQLPPIGFGKPFSDVISVMQEQPQTYEPHWAQLEVNCRAEMSDQFVEFTRVFSNESKFAEGYLQECRKEGVVFEGGLEIVFWHSREEMQDRLAGKVDELLKSDGKSRSGLPAFLGIIDSTTKPSQLDKFQVLSPYRSGYFGSSGINLLFQDVMRVGAPFQKKGGGADVVFKLFDKVIHTQNEYKGSELLVSNGSLGAIVDNGKVFFADHDSPIVLKTLRTRDMLELAYAITVHKSQGSGFGHVFIVLPEKAQWISRELLYTALTRAKYQVTLFIQQGDKISPAHEFLQSVRSRSATVGRRTSLFATEGDRYAYSPDDGVVVKSRVEYIIYRKLLEAKAKTAKFSFAYEPEYEVKNLPFNLHPDFVIQLADGRVIYWEHLGRVTSRPYMNDWDKRRAVYESQHDFKKVITTDELRGISDEKIELIIEKIVSNDLISEDSSDRYSHMHFSLR